MIKTEHHQTKRLKVLILEDNFLVCDRLNRIISSSHEFEIANVHHNIANFRANNLKDRNDILIVDLHLPDGLGFDAILENNKNWGNSFPIVLSALQDPESVIKAIKFGAKGYILKDDSSMDILNCLRDITDGKSPISTSVAKHLFNLISEENKEKKFIESEYLTKRELEVLNAISKGFSNKEVGVILNISENTVPVHIRNIYRKLQTNNRSEAAFEGRRLGLIKD